MPTKLDWRFPWGKHQDEPLEKVPSGYLEWALAKAENLKPPLREAIEDELVERGEWVREEPAAEAHVGAHVQALVQEVGIDPLELSQTWVAWYRRMADQFRDDPQAFAALNLMTEEFAKAVWPLYDRLGLPSHAPRPS